MNDSNQMLEFHKIIEKLKSYALTEKAKDRFESLIPFMDEKELLRKLEETTESKKCLEKRGTPPLASVKGIGNMTEAALRGELLSIDELEEMRKYAASCNRLKKYLLQSQELGIGISAYGNGINDLDFAREEIEKSIRNGRVDDYASKELKEIRRKLEAISTNIKMKLETILRSKKSCFSENFVSNRNGHFTLPVKKECKFQISGSVIDTSASGATYFIEPTAVSKLKTEYEAYKIKEDNEERKILYTLAGLVGDCADEIILNLQYIEELDYIFAKGKLSIDMNAVPAHVNTERMIHIVNGRHPLIPKEICIPLNIEMGNEIRGIVITGPNTGGKTVALKTVGLLSLMSQCGLHVPADSADLCMNSQVLCDVGDGQNISENLSTFSAHIKNVIHVIKQVNKETLVLMDELGSGTDPSEGMGIAIAILDELKESECNFIATTHYAQVKEYANHTKGLLNARMTFDKESLKPLYHLEMGEAGESCALYIAKQLGMPKKMLLRAYEETYHKTHVNVSGAIEAELLQDALELSKEESNNHIRKSEPAKEVSHKAARFELGDSVMVYPQKKLGIVFEKANLQGEVGVQIQKEKIYANHKRIQLKAAAKDLYPEDYDFSIIFDSVETRKLRHAMERKHVPGMENRLK